MVWGWYIIRSRSVWFFTPSNPKLTFGGMEGEPKREMYDLLPSELFPTTINILPSEPIEHVIEKINAKINMPFIVKPEIGGQGILFRKIDTLAQLREYHSKIPVEYIIQEMVLFSTEVSIFYYRYPNETKGFVTGFLKKVPLQVIGDGKSTLFQLILNKPKAIARIDEIKKNHEANFNLIPGKNEVYKFSHAANHNRGAQFINLSDQIDEHLISVFDKISLNINDFFYGRYDVMCHSIEDLKKGINFSILEYNGCGAEPNHIYDSGYSLLNAYKEILKHWKVLYQISSINESRGNAYWGFKKGYSFLKNTKRYYQIMKDADAKIP